MGGGCNNGDSRLVSFNGLTGSRSEGRVEVCINNQWGTVCAANSWTNHNTKVVCRQLGYSDQYFEKLIYSNEKGYIPIALRNVQCNGNESNLLSCNQSADSSCTHIQDVGIRCYCKFTMSNCVHISLSMRTILHIYIYYIIQQPIYVSYFTVLMMYKVLYMNNMVFQ